MALVLGCLVVFTVFAEQLVAQVESDEDRAFLEELERTFRKGGSYAAQQDLAEYLVDFPASSEAHTLAARVAFDRGQLEQVEQHLRAAGAPDAAVAPRLWGRVLLRLGRHEEALRFGEDGGHVGLAGVVLQVQALDALGRRADAKRLARDVVSEVDDRLLDGYGLIDLSRLLIFLRDFELANQALVFADAELNGRRGRNYRVVEPEVLVLIGRVYAATRQSSGGADPALSVLNEVLDVDSNHAAALCVKARVYRYGMQGGKETAALAKALSRDPTHPEALFLRGQSRLFNRRVDAALEDADALLSVDPRHRDALALRAAALEAAGRPAAADARQAFVDAHAESAALEALLGEVLQNHYRFAESIAPLERALAIEPDDEQPLPTLAQSLAHVGREQEARAALEEHGRRSPYGYPWRDNMLRVLERLRDSVDVVTDSGFRLRLPVGEQDVLGPLLAERLAAARADMAARWGVEPEGEVLVEVFDQHADFSVRTIGFSGLGALGVCFGNVITMLSPLSEMRGNYHWPQTALHEYAHVVTLELSKKRVPRWLTEGVSVWEEKQFDPSWARQLERDMLDARANGALLPVGRLNEAFRDGATILRGYHQGSLLCEVIVRDFGFEKLRDLVAAFGEERSTAQAIRHALGIEPEQLDARLEAYFSEVMEPRARIRPRYTEAGKNRLRERVRSGDEQALLQLASAYHDLGRRVDEDATLNRYLKRYGETPQAQRVLAERDAAAGRNEKAIERLLAWIDSGLQVEADGMRLLGELQLASGERAEGEASLLRAWELFPSDVGPNGALRRLLSLVDPGEDPERWEELAQAICAFDETAVSLRVRLARAAARDGRLEQAVTWLSQACDVDPYLPDLRMDLAEHLVALGREQEARVQWGYVLGMRADQVPGDSGPGMLGMTLPGGADGGGELAELQAKAREALSASQSDGDPEAGDALPGR